MVSAKVGFVKTIHRAQILVFDISISRFGKFPHLLVGMALRRLCHRQLLTSPHSVRDSSVLLF